MATKPIIKNKRVIAKTRLFTIEKVQLQFSNGVRCDYERSFNENSRSVLVIPLLDQQTFVMVREYVVAFDRYELGFVKGLMEAQETVLATANRELIEEIGLKASYLKALYCLSTAPGYTNHQTTVVVAEKFCVRSLPGDEPENLKTMLWSTDEIDRLLCRDDVTDARTLAALYLLQKYLK